MQAGPVEVKMEDPSDDEKIKKDSDSDDSDSSDSENDKSRI